MRTAVVISLLCLSVCNSSYVYAQEGVEDQKSAKETIFSLGGYGYSGRTTEAYQKMELFVRTNDTAHLSSWLRSGDPVLQLYALEGYKRTGKAVSTNDQALVASVLSGKDEVLTFSGCFASHRTVKQIAEENGYSNLLKK